MTQRPSAGSLQPTASPAWPLMVGVSVHLTPDGFSALYLTNCLLVSLTHILASFPFFLSLPPSESLRSELITAGAVPSLVSSLSFPLSSVQTSIAEALSMLACDTTARDQVGGKRESLGREVQNQV